MTNGNETASEVPLEPFCVYIIVLIMILCIIFAIYLYYFQKKGLKRGKKHRCGFCGELVDVMSDCCNAPVVERFLMGVCQKCGKDCKIICTRCRKNISG